MKIFLPSYYLLVKPVKKWPARSRPLIGLNFRRKQNSFHRFDVLGQRQDFVGRYLPDYFLGFGIEDGNHGSTAEVIDRKLQIALYRFDQIVELTYRIFQSFLDRFLIYRTGILLLSRHFYFLADIRLFTGIYHSEVDLLGR